MHIITRKRLNEFAEKHPNAKSGLYIRAVLTHVEYDSGKWKER
jgi:mRNA-degrading endonuclease HigB of HigAB toxin-antitoxin module